MNDVGFPVARVLDGIDAAAAAGLRRSRSTWSSSAASTTTPSSTMAGTSAAPATSCASSSTWTSAPPTAGGWTTSCRRPRSWQRIDAALAARAGSTPNYRGEVANRYRYHDGAGEIGVIASVTQPFCGDCTRARLSAEGELYTCLFAAHGHDLRASLRDGATTTRRWRRGSAASGAAAATATRSCAARPRRDGRKVEMSHIGG